MRYDPGKHHRRSIRLPGYDYAQAGAYFVTMVTYGRECLFGEVEDGEVALSEYGHIVQDEWKRSPRIRHEIALDEFVVMPNHVHGIVIITDDPVGATGRSPLRPTSDTLPTASISPAAAMPPTLATPPTAAVLPTSDMPPAADMSPKTSVPAMPRGPARRSLGSFIGGFKSSATKRINALRKAPGVPVWQRNYYEHVIRDDASLGQIRQYIEENPLRWADDPENPVVGATGRSPLQRRGPNLAPWENP